MRLVTFTTRDGGARIGALTDDGEGIVDFVKDAPGLPGDMTELIEGADGALAMARHAQAAAKSVVPLSEATLLAPIPKPRRNIFCVGKNYYDHAQEFEQSGFDKTSAGSAVPDEPIIFTKATTSVIGPNVAIQSALDPTGSLDYEAEIAFVIGKAGRGIAKAQAYGHIFGYTIINDVTARTIQRRHAQWFLGKSMDGFCPMGPYLVTADEVGDVTAINLTTRVNGEVRQEASVSDLIFDIPTLVECLSLGMTLEPGDIVSTGTPAGVGIGFKPPKFLKPGDRVAIAFDRLGVLENPVP